MEVWNVHTIVEKQKWRSKNTITSTTHQERWNVEQECIKGTGLERTIFKTATTSVKTATTKNDH